jgi:adenine phosphoribosyltransferase
MPTPSTESSSSHRHPDLDSSSAPSATAPRPPAAKPESADNAQGRLSSSAASGAAELAGLQVRLRAALRQFHDFPSPGILFEDILPIFQNPDLHDSLLRALHIQIDQAYGDSQKPDVIVGLEARGFLFGPSLALRLGAAFVPVRKKGKLPGPVETAAYQKEYGQDFFQIQQDAIKPGQRVLIVDDIIATGEMMTPKLPPLLSNTLAR